MRRFRYFRQVDCMKLIKGAMCFKCPYSKPYRSKALAGIGWTQQQSQGQEDRERSLLK